MPLTIRAIPVLSDNYAWFVRDEATGITAVVDPGEATAIERALEKEGGRLDFILLTHHHQDHIGGTDALRARYNAKVAGPAAEQHRMPHLDLALNDNDRIELGQSTGQVLAMPGHTLGHIAYYFDQPPALFCGDVLFSLGCGRLFEGTAEQMFASLVGYTTCQNRPLCAAGMNTQPPTPFLPGMWTPTTRLWPPERRRYGPCATKACQPYPPHWGRSVRQTRSYGQVPHKPLPPCASKKTFSNNPLYAGTGALLRRGSTGVRLNQPYNRQ